VRAAASLDEAVRLAADTGAAEIMVIGGGQLYAAALPQADRLYITHVAARPEGDTHFPAIDAAMWRPVSEERLPAGEKDSAATRFVIYERAVEGARG
jgi:dihydrofolate reductase